MIEDEVSSRYVVNIEAAEVNQLANGKRFISTSALSSTCIVIHFLFGKVHWIWTTSKLRSPLSKGT